MLAERIVKYRRYVKGFESIDELKEVYGLEDSLVEKLRPQFSLGVYKEEPVYVLRKIDSTKREEPWVKKSEEWQPSTEKFGTLSEKFTPYTPFTPVDLNTADSLTLEKAPGIGPLSAGRIVAYRKRLGFFHSVEQLQEVRGIFGENFERMKTLVTISENLSGLPHISINTDDGTLLRNHPYLGYKMANLIIAYRKEHGKFKDLNDCRKMLAISPETWDKLSPYLEF